MANILVTGGAGYKGTLLVKELLKKGHKVTILDNFMFGLEPALSFAVDRNCAIIKEDIRSLKKNDLVGYDVIYHLAGISGYPACEANPHSAQTINVLATEKLIKLLSGGQTIVYASTTSIYGVNDEEIHEETTPKPRSLYALTKLKAEDICMNRKNSIALRFATVFGVSAKMRCDLLVNDFVYRAVTEKSIVLFDSHSMRTFLHIEDAIKVYLMVLDHSEKMTNNIYNVGSKDLNYSKLEIAQKINKNIKIEIIESSLEDPDKRNFAINFDKLNKLGFVPEKTLNNGIKELIKLYSWYRPYNKFQTI